MAIMFSDDIVLSLYKEQGPLKDIQEHADLAKKQGFFYHLLYAPLVWKRDTYNTRQSYENNMFAINMINNHVPTKRD